MKVKILNLQTAPKLQVVKVIKELTNQGLKETKDQVDAAVASRKDSMEFETLCHKEHVKQAFDYCDLNYCFSDECPQYEEAEPKLQEERKLKEVTNDDLGVSIHSIDEETIGWQCKMLFTHEQATRVLNGLLDAKLKVTETHVVHEGDKVTMLTVVKTFPSGTRDTDIKKFDRRLHRFAYYVCEAINAEARLEAEKERAIEAFNELQNYE